MNQDQTADDKPRSILSIVLIMTWLMCLIIFIIGSMEVEGRYDVIIAFIILFFTLSRLNNEI